jgi:hypothetical protein
MFRFGKADASLSLSMTAGEIVAVLHSLANAKHLLFRASRDFRKSVQQ